MFQDRGWEHEVSRQSDSGRQRQLLVVIPNRRRVTSENLRLIIGLVVPLYAGRCHGSLLKSCLGPTLNNTPNER